MKRLLFYINCSHFSRALFRDLGWVSFISPSTSALTETITVPSPATAPPQSFIFPALLLPIHHSTYISLTHPVNCLSPLRFVATDFWFTMKTLWSIFRLTITALSNTAMWLCVKRPVSCVSTAKSYSSSARLILFKPFNWILLRNRLTSRSCMCSSTRLMNHLFIRRLSALSIFLKRTFFRM